MGEERVMTGRSMRRRLRLDRTMTWLMGLCVLLALIPLVLVLGYVLWRGASVLDWNFLTQTEPFDLSQGGGGAWNAIKGTLKLIVISSLISIPTGIAAAVYLNEYGRGRLAETVRFVSDVMTGVPSIFVGVFVYSLVVIATGGFSAFSGGLALAVIMLPIIIRATEEILRLVPQALREAAWALGVPRWRTVLMVVLPVALPGIVTGVTLAVARGAGETAPLLFTSFGNHFVTGWLDVNDPDSALPLSIYRNARSAYAAAQERAWAGALVLVILIVLLTTIARIATMRRAGRV
jgi:phosphate transport system permease protein